MKAFQITEWTKPPALVEVPRPEPGPGQLLIKVAGCGLCHSDLHMMHMPAEIGEGIGWTVPFTLGHEVGGWIERYGAGISGLEVGTPVALVSIRSCGTCRTCRQGYDNVCDLGVVGRGYGMDGGLADYVLLENDRPILPLHSLDPTLAGPLTDAAATTYHGFDRVRSKLTADATVLVIGAGGLGSFGVQYVKALTGARLIVADVLEDKLRRAKDYGADAVIDSSKTDLVREVLALTEKDGCQAVMDFVGNDETLVAGLRCLSKLGTLAIIGAGGGVYKHDLRGPLADKEADVFAYTGSTIEDTRTVLKLAEQGMIRNEVEIFPLDHVEEAYARLEAGTLDGRAVVRP